MERLLLKLAVFFQIYTSIYLYVFLGLQKDVVLEHRYRRGLSLKISFPSLVTGTLEQAHITTNIYSDLSGR